MVKVASKLRNWILSILGFAAVGSGASCDIIDNIIDTPCMYGMPTMDYKVSGKVADKDNNPVKGILVTVPESYSADSTWTSDDGSFNIKGQAWPEDEIKVLFEDIDGVGNGGEFNSKEEVVNLTRTKKADGAWYEGEFSADELSVTLEKKQ